MLPTFVIGLREGLEAALIVGIIAAFLRKQGRPDLLRAVLSGVTAAVLLCAGAGVALEIFSRNLPQRQQEGLETVIGALAVGMVTYMVVWMRRNSRRLKGQLEGMAADALAGRTNAGRAMVLMAFLAVIREGLETVVFLLAAFNETGSGSAAGLGATLGIAVAVALGYGIYRGGVRLNLSKFFRATGLVLVLVAAGLVVNAQHTAHEAGWLDAGQGGTVDLSWLVRPGSVQASLLTGMLGVQAHPVLIEIVGWLGYLVPVGLYVAWPPGRSIALRLVARTGAVIGALGAVAAVVLAVVAPSRPDQRPTTATGAMTAVVVSRGGEHAAVRTQTRQPVAGTTGAVTTYRLSSLGPARRAGTTAEAYRVAMRGAGAHGMPSTLDAARVGALNHGRLPIGITLIGGRVAATYRDAAALTVWLDIRTDRVVDLAWTETVTPVVRAAGGPFELSTPVATARVALPVTAVRSAVAQVRAARVQLDRRALLRALATWSAVLAVLGVAAALGGVLALRRRDVTPAAGQGEPARALVRS